MFERTRLRNNTDEVCGNTEVQRQNPYSGARSCPEQIFASQKFVEGRTARFLEQSRNQINDCHANKIATEFGLRYDLNEDLVQEGRDFRLLTLFIENICYNGLTNYKII